MTKDQYCECMNQLWNIWKSNSGNEISVHQWDKILNEAKEIWLSSGRDKLIENMIIAFIDDIDRKDPTRKEQ